MLHLMQGTSCRYGSTLSRWGRVFDVNSQACHSDLAGVPLIQEHQYLTMKRVYTVDFTYPKRFPMPEKPKIKVKIIRPTDAMLLRSESQSRA
jgi:hypothetical protein